MKNITCPNCTQEFKAGDPTINDNGLKIRLYWDCPYCYTPLFILRPDPVQLSADQPIVKLSEEVKNKVEKDTSNDLSAQT